MRMLTMLVSDGFMSVDAKLSKVYIFNKCDILYVNYTSMPFLKKGMKNLRQKDKY
jgi:hypothetical protein